MIRLKDIGLRRYFSYQVKGLVVVIMGLLFTGAVNAQSTSVIRIGVYENPPKLSYTDFQMTGIFGDVIYAVAEREGFRLEPVPCDWQQCLEMLEQGQIDLMPDVAIDQLRDRRFAFHRVPVLRSWSQLYGSNDVIVRNLLDLDDLRVAVLKDSVQDMYLRNLTESFDLSTTWVSVSSFEAGFQAVIEGRADLVAANHHFGDMRARQLELFATPVIFQPSRLYFAASRGGPAEPLLPVIDSYLEAWQLDPSSPLNQSLERWGLYATPASIPGYLIAALIIFGLALTATLAFVWTLRGRMHIKAAQLQLSENRFSTVLNSVEAYIYIKDRDLRYQYANRMVADLLQTTETDIIGKTDSDFFDDKTCANLRQNDLRVIEKGERVSDEETNVTAKGEKRTFLSTKIPLKDARGNVYALSGISTDISEHLHIQEQLNHARFYDTVTGLANRRLLLDRLEHALANAQRTDYEGALLAIDLHDFSVVNDAFGHQLGDQLLQEVARRMERLIDEADTAARLGADDFVVVLENLNGDREQAILDARQWALALIELLHEPFEIDGKHYVTSVSIGVTMFSDTEGGVEVLLRNADLALADAKQEGPHTIRFFNPSMQENVSRRVHLESAMRNALEHNHFHFFVQPQVDSQHHVTGVELLMRWSDAELGYVPPSEFIPVAEATGLIVPMGEWLLGEAARLMQRWQEDPLLRDLTVAVNISAKQFRHAGFVDMIKRLIQQPNVNASLLELEITESMLIEDVQNTVRRIAKLNEWGVRFSLDDFGTGYASLSYLKQLPIYQLKIDQSFIRDILTDTNDEIIVSTILGLGRSMGLEVIAEGVETAQQARRLNEMGCAKYQGFHFGRPASPVEWEARLRESRLTIYAGGS